MRNDYKGFCFGRLILFSLSDEISKQIYDASPKIIITQGPQLDTLRTALNMLKRDVPTIFVKERVSFILFKTK